MFDSYRENTLRYYPERCINCKRCTQVCPHGVFAEGPEHAELVSPSSCMECGACAGNCPVDAITVESGVGCAWAMIGAALRGRDMDAGCDCCGTDGTCCQTPGADDKKMWITHSRGSNPAALRAEARKGTGMRREGRYGYKSDCESRAPSHFSLRTHRSAQNPES